MFSLNMAMTCSSTHARDTAQLSPGAGGADAMGRGQPAALLFISKLRGRPGTERQECRKARCCFLFAITMASGSLIMVVFGMDQKWFPFPWVFESSLCSLLLLWVLRKLLKAPIVLSLFPFLPWGSPRRLLPELCRAVPPGQCSPLSFTSVLNSFILKSQDQSEEQMDC